MNIFERFVYAFSLFFSVLFSSETARQLKSFSKDEEIQNPVLDNTVSKKEQRFDQNTGLYQLLNLFQREGRLIDFLKEDILSYSDEEVGAVSRSVHAGCQKVIQKYMQIETLTSAQEESKLTVETGFNPMEYRLLGQVADKGPYFGTLLHPGWKISHLNMPELEHQCDLEMIAPIEVEIVAKA